MNLDRLVDIRKIEHRDGFLHERDAPAEETVDVAEHGVEILVPSIHVVPSG